MYVVCAFCSTSASEEEAKELKSREDFDCGGTAEDATRGVCSSGEKVKGRLVCLSDVAIVAVGVAGVIYRLPADSNAVGLMVTRRAVSTIVARCGAGLEVREERLRSQACEARAVR